MILTVDKKHLFSCLKDNISFLPEKPVSGRTKSEKCNLSEKKGFHT